MYCHFLSLHHVVYCTSICTIERVLSIAVYAEDLDVHKLLINGPVPDADFLLILIKAFLVGAINYQTHIHD